MLQKKVTTNLRNGQYWLKILKKSIQIPPDENTNESLIPSWDENLIRVLIWGSEEEK